MTQSYPTPEIFDIDRADIALESWPWPFATDCSADIDRYFSELQSRRPGVWNGRVLLLNRYAIAERALRGACFETDYSSFITWRDREFADLSVYNFFAAAVLRAADGGYLLGEMASYTAGAGRSYFPCGTPEPDDVSAGGTFDLDDLDKHLANFDFDDNNNEEIESDGREEEGALEEEVDAADSLGKALLPVKQVCLGCYNLCQH